MSGTVHKFSVVANTSDGSQLVGSGYRGLDQMRRAIDERIYFHTSGTTRLHSIVVVRDDGQTVTFWPALRHVGPAGGVRHLMQVSRPEDTKRYMQWSRDEEVTS